MATEEYSVGYEAGYQEGWNKAIDSIAQPEQEPVAKDWSVFNTGAEVWSGLSLADAVADLTPDRLERGWSAVCVIDKDNPPFYTTPPQQEPRNFCPRCGKRTADLTVIHTCTPPEGGHQ